MDSQGSLIEKIIRAAFGQKAAVLMLAALGSVLGVMAYQQMPRNVYPDITIPIFTIVTENEAMAPEEIEMTITRPMESAMNGLPGVQRVRSQTTQGLSSVVVDFDIETEFWRARHFITERMAQVAAQLPPGTDPPTLASATTRLAEVFEYAVEGDRSLAELREIAEWQIRYSLLTVPGVAEVLNMGGFMRQYRVSLDPNRLQAHKVALAEIEEAIRGANENAAGGFIGVGAAEYVVRGIGRFNSIEDIGDTIIAARDGVPLFLRDVATIEESSAIRRGIASRNGRETVVALVIKQPMADTIQVVEGIKEALDDLRDTLPKDVRIVPYYDQGILIRQSLSSVTRAILAGAALVVFVLLLFLGRLRSTLVVAASIPLSAIIAGILMKQFGIGLNTMSLGGIAIAVGIMVDASIIMVENIHHHFQQRRGNIHNAGDKDRAALHAAMEVGRPIAFATFVIIAVFLPLFIMGGIEGLLYRPLAITVAAAMLGSLVLSLTVTPILSARFLRPDPNEKGEGEVRFVRWIKKGYAPLLEFALLRRWLAIALALAFLAPTVAGLAVIGKNFMPRLDEGAWVISTATPPETSLEQNDRITGQIEKLLIENPNVADVVRRNGRSERAIGCVLPVNLGEIIVNLKPKDQRNKPTEQILAEVREQIEQIPSVATAFTQPLQLKMDESLEGTPAPLQVKIFGPDMRMLETIAKEIAHQMEEIPGLADVKMEQATGIPQLQIRIDRQAAARYGIPVKTVSKIVQLAIGGEELTQIWENQRSYGVFVRFDDSMRGSPEAIRNIMVDAPSGQRIPLGQIAQISLAEGPNVIFREAMNRRIGIDASIQGRDLGSVVADIRKAIQTMQIPHDYYIAFGGQYQSQQRALHSLAVAFGVALAIVLTLLYIALRSFLQAALILTTVPSAFAGGVASLFLAGETINVSSAVGFIALFGIAVQNSLVLLTQTRSFIAEGHDKEKAVRLASVQRLRPKLMTAACTGLGLLPILLGTGAGAEIEKPLAIVMTGGLVTSTLFTLLLLPALYLAANRTKNA